MVNILGTELPRAAAKTAAPTKPRGFPNILALEDFEASARRILPRSVYRFIAGGAETDASVRANRAAFAAWSFRPRMLSGIAQPPQATSLFGRAYAAPFGIAPMGAACVACFEADLALAGAARDAGIPFILSGASTEPLERVRRETGAVWFQAYISSDRERIGALIDRVAAAQYEVLVVTVDVPVMGNREYNLRSGMHMPIRPTPALAFDGLTHPRWFAGTLARTLLGAGVPRFENSEAEHPGTLLRSSWGLNPKQRSPLGWDDVAWIRARWPGRLVIKGVLTAEDAVRARDRGADGVIVSNHGGRQLDGAAASLAVLPEITAALPDYPVMLDSGVRRGTDVLKALALGACFVFLGRPFLYAAAAGGQSGVAHAIGLLRREVERDLALLGCAELGAVDRSLLTSAIGSF